MPSEIMSLEAVIADIKRRPVVPAWPHVAVLLHKSRNGFYDGLKNKDFCAENGIFRDCGTWRAVSATLRERYSLDSSEAA